MRWWPVGAGKVNRTDDGGDAAAGVEGAWRDGEGRAVAVVASGRSSANALAHSSAACRVTARPRPRQIEIDARPVDFVSSA
jgi:hypothetical protein